MFEWGDLAWPDRVRTTTTTSGVAPLDVSNAPPQNCQPFSVLADGAKASYICVNPAGVQVEIGIGTYDAETETLDRTTILWSSTGGAVVDLGAGTKTVMISLQGQIIGDLIAAVVALEEGADDPIAMGDVTGLIAALADKLDDSQATATGLAVLGAANQAAGRTALGLGSAAVATTGTAAGNVPLLDGGGKLLSSILPAVAISETFIVNSQAAQVALTAERGDLAIRTDLSKSFVLATDDPTTFANWKELLTPTDQVLAVAGLTGTISAAALKTALSLVPGTDVQAYHANLAALAGLVGAANKLPYFTAAGTMAITDLSAFARTLLDDADAAAMKATLGITAAGYEQIGATQTPTGASSSITSIPTTYSDLLIEVLGLSHDNGTTQFFRIETSADGATWSTATNISNTAISNSVPIYGSVEISGYRRGSGRIFSSIGDVPSDNQIATSNSQIGRPWRHSSGINAIRLSWAAGNFDAGSWKLWGK